MAGGLPTSETIARALVCIARGLGEMPSLGYWLESGGWTGATRPRWIVIAALDAAYPKVGVRRICGWLNMPAADYAEKLARMRAQAWWSETLLCVAVQLVAP